MKNKPKDINVSKLDSETIYNVTNFTYLENTISYIGSLSTHIDARK